MQEQYMFIFGKRKSCTYIWNFSSQEIVEDEVDKEG